MIPRKKHACQRRQSKRCENAYPSHKSNLISATRMGCGSPRRNLWYFLSRGGFVPLLTVVFVAISFGNQTCVSVSRRRWLSAVCVVDVALRLMSAMCSASRRNFHSFHSYVLSMWESWKCKGVSVPASACSADWVLAVPCTIALSDDLEKSSCKRSRWISSGCL